MNKQTFLGALEKRLSRLSREDRARILSFYAEMIKDRMEDGETEEEAVAAVGTAEEVAAQVLSETPPSMSSGEYAPRRTIKVWERGLLILGSPLWLPLLLTGVLLILTLYILLFAILLTLYAVDLSLILGGVAFAAAAFACRGNIPSILVVLGMGLVSGGLGIACFPGLNRLGKCMLGFVGKLLLKMKSLFVRKGETE